jgi:type III secretory pathway lipoprotein EscJ
MLVANSVQGLNYDKVSVVLVPVPHVDTPPLMPEEAAWPDWRLSGLIGGGAIGLMAMLVLVFRRHIGNRLAGIKAPLPEPAE